MPFDKIRNWARLGLVCTLWLLGFFAVAPSLLAAEDAPVLRTAKEVFRPDEPIYVFVDNPPTNNWSWLTVAKPGAHNMEHGDKIYLKDHAPTDHRNRWYTLPPQEEGDYELRLFLRNNLSLGATLPIRVAATEGGGPPSILTPVFADRLIEFVAGNQSRYPEPFGHVEGPYRPGPIDPAIVLGNPGPGPFNSSDPKLEFLTLPKGSFVTVGFSKHVLVDRPGPDFFVRGVDLDESAGEVAEVLVSTDLETFHPVDQIRAAGSQPLDLANLGLTGPVTAIRVVGVDLKGAYPGYELVSVEVVSALPRDQLDPSATEKAFQEPPQGKSSQQPPQEKRFQEPLQEKGS